MTEEQEERIVASWEAIAKSLGDFNEIAKRAINKQWPEPRQPREAVVSKPLTAEEKLKQQTGNTDGTVEEWLSEFEPEEEIGPREREFLAAQGKNKSKPSSTKAST